jgi:hypothetical protein
LYQAARNTADEPLENRDRAITSPIYWLHTTGFDSMSDEFQPAETFEIVGFVVTRFATIEESRRRDLTR